MNYFSARNILLTFLLVLVNAAYCASIFVNHEGFGECSYRPLTINAGKQEPVIIMGLKPGRTYKVQITNKTKEFEHNPNKILLNISEKLFKVNPISSSLLQIIFPEIQVLQSPHIITFDLVNPDEANCNYEISVAGNEREIQQKEQKQREEYYRKIDLKEDKESQQVFKTMQTVIQKDMPLFNLNMKTGNVTFGSGMKLVFKETQNLFQENDDSKTDSGTFDID